MSQRRTNIEIVGDILRSLHAERGQMKPTHVMYKANLSHKLLKEYLEELAIKQLIEEAEAEGRKVIKLTDKGLDFLKQFDKLKEFRESFGI